jgi:hypothetical protein
MIYFLLYPLVGSCLVDASFPSVTDVLYYTRFHGPAGNRVFRFEWRESTEGARVPLEMPILPHQRDLIRVYCDSICRYAEA